MALPDEAFWAAWNSLFGIGSRKLIEIIRACGGAEAAWRTPELQIADSFDGVDAAILARRRQFDVESNYGEIKSRGMGILTFAQGGYPHSLRSISCPPAVLYFRGEFPEPHLLHLAVVGTRRASAYGLNMAESLSRGLAQSGAVVVSGMARGIDTYAHRGAIHGSGRTIAVLGCGMDVVYPRENEKLMRSISENGVVLTEFPLGTPPLKNNFPARNRIISGLCSGVIVVEAPEKSGALITADFALEQGREVFAVPGPATSANSRGCNRLIKDGAKMVESVGDVLEEFELVPAAASAGEAETEGYDAAQQEILLLLSGGPVFMEELCSLTGKSPAEISVLISEMELGGLVERAEGKIRSRT